MQSARTFLRNAAVTGGIALTLTGVVVAPAVAAESGVITKPFGYNYPTLAACDDAGTIAMRQRNADDWSCYHQSDNTYDGYLHWYT